MLSVKFRVKIIDRDRIGSVLMWFVLLFFVLEMDDSIHYAGAINSILFVF